MTDVVPPPLPVAEHQPGSSQSAGQSIDEGKGRVFPCEQCGADLTFHIGQQELKCPYCGFQKPLEIAPDAQVREQDFHAALERLKELRQKTNPDEAAAEYEVRCEACGANVVFSGTLTSSECPYCANPLQRDKVHTAPDRIAVDAVLPFAIDRDRARQNLTDWVRSRWFAPNEFLKRGVDGKFSGVYLPYWTFDSMTATRYSGARGDHYYETVGSGKDRKTVRRTRWTSASGDFQRFFDDVLVCATRGMSRDLILSLEPWPLGKGLPFTQEVLAGYLARTYDTELDQAFPEAKQRIDEAIRSEVRSRIGGDEQRIDDIDSLYEALTYKHLLLPLWLLAYRYHDKVYQVMVNAATGEVQGERPYSWIKITLAVIAGTIVAGAAATLFSHAQ